MPDPVRRATPVVTGLMLPAAAYLLVWEYERLRGPFGFGAGASFGQPPEPRPGGKPDARLNFRPTRWRPLSFSV